ncbi:hypothetical protein AB6809_29625 [Paraburkholderia sp. RCC_158]|uniref:hypothetical protein n=1 Tax=Paraburkholderia sp. RCC_158 TaxID=3239220 RepID=UPI0035252672
MSDTQDWTTMTAEQLIARGHKPVAIQHTEKEGWQEVSEQTAKPRVEIRDWSIIDNRLHGYVDNHPTLGNAGFVRTSPIVRANVTTGVVQTQNTLYVLVGDGVKLTATSGSRFSVTAAVNTLKAAMKTDGDIAWGWHCNIAMAFYDAAGDTLNKHRISNEGAARFMRNAFDVDVTQFPEYQALVKGWALLEAGGHLKGHQSIAEMVSTHTSVWREALAHMLTNKAYDRAYVEHEIKALADIEAACKVEVAAQPPVGNSASVAAIQFALDADEGMTWLRLWNQGEFESCRREWPEAPDECYIGADQFFTPKPE